MHSKDRALPFFLFFFLLEPFPLGHTLFLSLPKPWPRLQPPAPAAGAQRVRPGRGSGSQHICQLTVGCAGAPLFSPPCLLTTVPLSHVCQTAAAMLLGAMLLGSQRREAPAQSQQAHHACHQSPSVCLSAAHRRLRPMRRCPKPTVTCFVCSFILKALWLIVIATLILTVKPVLACGCLLCRYFLKTRRLIHSVECDTLSHLNGLSCPQLLAS